MKEGHYLTGQFLIAMPTLADPNFNRTVTYICEHSETGALGIIINRPIEDMSYADVLDQVYLSLPDADLAARPVLHGGPVQPECGFVIHDGTDREFSSTINVPDGLKVTTSGDILEAMASGNGPRRVVIALGHAGWAAGQLESEMAANAWLTVPADHNIIFSVPFALRWEAAMQLLGFDISSLSSQAGHG